jgi:hypothetical protein
VTFPHIASAISFSSLASLAPRSTPPPWLSILPLTNSQVSDSLRVSSALSFSVSKAAQEEATDRIFSTQLGFSNVHLRLARRSKKQPTAPLMLRPARRLQKDATERWPQTATQGHVLHARSAGRSAYWTVRDQLLRGNPYGKAHDVHHPSSQGLKSCCFLSHIPSLKSQVPQHARSISNALQSDRSPSSSPCPLHLPSNLLTGSTSGLQ